MNSDCDDDKAKLILAWMWIIEESDKQSAAFLYKHIKQIIDPVRPIPNYQINMNKNPNHEIYLRGKISKNPYWTKDIGSTMKDVLDKICLTHEMSHATDLIEMLVANNIVSPDIPIHLVYEKVWYPYIYKLRNPDQYEVPKISTVDQSYKTPMDVIYRLVGVDGEASENRVEQLQDENDLVKDPEKKYALARTLSQRLPNGHSGLGILFEDLSKNSKRQEDTHLLSWLLPVLNLALKIKDNIKEIIQINGADVLVDKLYTLMSLEANEEEQLLIDQVIAILEQIVIAKSSFASFDMEVDNDKRSTGKENIKNVTMILDKIINWSEQMLEAGKSVFSTPESIVAISRILPFLAKTKEAEQKIAEVFSPHISNIHYLERDSCANREDKFKVEFYLERFFNWMESANNFIKDTFTEYGIAQQLCTYLSQTLNDDWISNEDWLLKNEKQLSLVLKSLALYWKSNAKAQEVIYQNQNGDLLKLLFKMSQARTNERKLSILAEGIIEVLANEKDVKCSQAYEFVKGLVDKARLAKRQKAKKSKAALSKTIKASDLIKKNVSLARIQKEQIACIVCQEGYQSNDKDLIGVYVFVKKVTMCPDKIVSHVEEFGYTTVTHFNTIHLKWHRNAYSADWNRKKPLSEWEGAQIRNSHAKCNALLPLKGCSISEDQFKQSISDYYSGLNYSIYNVSLNRSRVIMNDLKNVLRKFAFEESFSKDSNGGEGEHNINLIPLMLHMELIMIKDDSNWSLEKQQKDCERFISEYDFEQNQDLIDNSNEEVKGYEVEEDAKFENIDEAGDPDFEVLAKSASDKLESWMYQTLASSVFSSQNTWDEQKINLFKIGKHLAKANSKYLPVSDQIFILSEELKENQLEMTSKSSLNRYSNSIKKVILYLAMVSIIRQRFISVEGNKIIDSLY